MKYLSVCSGIEAATVAWHDLGWEPSAFSEIEPFPSAVLKHHYPKIKNLGDMTKFEEWDVGTIDLLVGGTPCQSFSVAGLRKGLDDPRGNLMLTYGAIARRFRPKWLVWENVPGVLSSNEGRDFATFLGMLAELGYGFAYRVLDAQYFGVAQRRRRVFVVGYLGNWHRAAAVLFESSSLSGNPKPSREARKGTTPSSQSSPTYGGSNAECADTVTSKRAKGSGGPSGNEGGLFVAHTLRAKHNAGEDGIGRGTPLVPVEIPEVMSTLLSSTAGISRPGNAVTEHETYIPMAFAQNTRDEVRWVNGDGQIVGALAAESGMKQTTYVAQPMVVRESGQGYWMEDEIAGTLRAEGEDRPSRPSHVIAQPIPYDLHQVTAPVNRQAREPGDPCHTLAKQNAHNAGIVSIQGNLIGRKAGGPQGVGASDEGVMYTLTKADVHGIVQPIAWDEELNPSVENAHNAGIVHAFDARQSEVLQYGNISGPLDTDGHSVGVMQTMAVRRLTPVECERLQGFPDNYTNIRDNCPDGPRYKALGNSMAVPVMRWIGERIRQVDEL